MQQGAPRHRSSSVRSRIGYIGIVDVSQGWAGPDRGSVVLAWVGPGPQKKYPVLQSAYRNRSFEHY